MPFLCRRNAELNASGLSGTSLTSDHDTFQSSSAIGRGSAEEHSSVGDKPSEPAEKQKDLVAESLSVKHGVSFIIIIIIETYPKWTVNLNIPVSIAVTVGNYGEINMPFKHLTA